MTLVQRSFTPFSKFPPNLRDGGPLPIRLSYQLESALLAFDRAMGQLLSFDGVQLLFKLGWNVPMQYSSDIPKMGGLIDPVLKANSVAQYRDYATSVLPWSQSCFYHFLMTIYYLSGKIVFQEGCVARLISAPSAWLGLRLLIRRWKRIEATTTAVSFPRIRKSPIFCR